MTPPTPTPSLQVPTPTELEGLLERLRAMVSADGRSICCDGRTTRQMGVDILLSADAITALLARIKELEGALGPFARIAGPINGEDGRPTYLDALEGKEPTGELYLGSHYGTTRIETLWADDFRRARATLNKDSAHER